MPLMTWTDKLSVGVAALDDDHKRLIAMVNELNAAIQAGRGRDAIGGILGELVRYTRDHFAREERLFARTGYPAAASHKQEHEVLTRQVLDVQQKYASGAVATLSQELLLFLKNWLLNHIQCSDQGYRPHLNAKGIH